MNFATIIIIRSKIRKAPQRMNQPLLIRLGSVGASFS